MNTYSITDICGHNKAYKGIALREKDQAILVCKKCKKELRLTGFTVIKLEAIVWGTWDLKVTISSTNS